MRRWPQSSQPSTWPPSAAVRQVSIADITLSWSRLTCPALAARQAGPCRRKMSATSSAGRTAISRPDRHLPSAARDARERWLGKFGQPDKWFFCLTAVKMPRIRSKNDEASTADAQPQLQGEGGAGGDQG